MKKQVESEAHTLKDKKEKASAEGSSRGKTLTTQTTPVDGTEEVHAKLKTADAGNALY